MFPQRPDHSRSAIYKGNRACPCRAFHTKPGAGQGNAQVQNGHRAGRKDQQEVQDHVHPVHDHTDPHGCACISRGSQHRPQQDGGSSEQHGKIYDQEIACRQIPDFRIHLHPYRNLSCTQHCHSRKHCTQDEGDQTSLCTGLPGPFRMSGTDLSGNKGQETDSNRRHDAADHPVHSTCGPHRGCRLRSECPYHCRVNILYSGLCQLLQHGRPGKGKHRSQHGTVKPASQPHRSHLRFPVS